MYYIRPFLITLSSSLILLQNIFLFKIYFHTKFLNAIPQLVGIQNISFLKWDGRNQKNKMDEYVATSAGKLFKLNSFACMNK